MLYFHYPRSLLWCGSLIGLLLNAGLGRSAESVNYLKEVKPIFAERCYACHGGLQQKAGLRVDTALALREAGVVVAGRSDESPLLAHLVGQEGYDRMPPPSEGEALSARQIEVIRRWIDEGAIAPADEAPDPDPREHWAFRAPRRPPVPAGKFANPIDRFLAQQWAERGLVPQQPADPRRLLRRLYLDLIGLPPTPQELQAFLNDPSPDAYEKVVDRLLASPQYGERWARHFLDIWRYSDWWGLGDQVRNSQKHMWHWRDWAVESFNADIGYDEMIRQMLAADELYPNDLQKLRATGYLARQYFLFNRTTWLDETIEHTGKAFLGLTLNCAKCHDHKYDPVSMNDYYHLRAFFEPYQVRLEMVPGQVDFEKNGIPRVFDCNAEAPTYKHIRGDDRNPDKSRTFEPRLPALLAYEPLQITPVSLPVEAHSPQLRPHVLEAYRSAARSEGEEAVKAVEARAEAERLKVTGPAEAFREAAAKAAKLEAQLALVKAQAALDKAEAALAQADEKKKEALTKARDAARSAWEKAKKTAENPGEKYTPLLGARKSPESNIESKDSQMKPFPTTSTGRRTAFARWIADARNPLTARVLVNHLWLRHFGQPIVPTIFDFGRKGAKPTHPELLDWLAVELTDNRWSIKHLHRLMVTSYAYRMSSSTVGVPASNLAMDPENRFLWRQNPSRMEAQVVRDSLLHLAGKLDLTLGGPAIPAAQESNRRSLYYFQSHNEFNKFLSQFDDANVRECYRRSVSIVPQQSLTLANSRLALTMTEAIAARLAQQPLADDAAFIAAAWEWVLCQPPNPAEMAACLQALAEWRKVVPPAKARTNLVGVLVNHNDFITIR